MLDRETRKVILRLHAEGQGLRAIARLLKLSRNSVKKVLLSDQVDVPERSRSSIVLPYKAQIIELYARCAGNLVRVHEELAADGITISYSTLTHFCRRQGIGVKVPQRSGRYHFAPGEEMQHDTSPHKVVVGGKVQVVYCASLVLCFSRVLFAQVYPRFNRFYCKAFLTAAVKYFNGVAKVCMVDNTSVLIVKGTGANAVPAAEMKLFGERLGFRIKAHEKGDANRSARVEGPFFYIERNFYPGRKFKDINDLNQQLRAWCVAKKHRFLREVQARPIDLYQTDRLHLQPLPQYLPEVYLLHSRIVNLEGFVQVHSNCYSVPDEFLCQRVQVRETLEKIQVYSGRHKLVAEHERQAEGMRARVVDQKHHRPRRNSKPKSTPAQSEEKILRAAAPELDQLVTAIINKGYGRPGRRIRRLYRFYLDYPTEALCQAAAHALAYGLTDLERIERMTLRHVAGDYFRLPIKQEQEDTNE